MQKSYLQKTSPGGDVFVILWTNIVGWNWPSGHSPYPIWKDNPEWRPSISWLTFTPQDVLDWQEFHD